MNKELLRAASSAQRSEITEYYIYRMLAEHAKISENKKILLHIANDELRHYHFFARITGKKCKPARYQLLWSLFLAKILGITFALQLREAGESLAQQKYARLDSLHGIRRLIKDEEHHEQLLIKCLKDERLSYAGSIVLGLNDAIVELTGALAGLTLALRETKIVAIAGLVTGVAAALSMASSGYFASKEDRTKNPRLAAFYTGITYLIVVLFLVMPYFIFSSVFLALFITWCIAVGIIAAYTFFISVAKKQSFWRRFLEMLSVSLSVAIVSFLLGWVLRETLF